MIAKTLLVAGLAVSASAQMMNLTAALGSIQGLNNLTTYLQLFPEVIQTLSSVQNVTLLAPNNAAFSKLLSSPAASSFNVNNSALVDALFSYHVLNGTYYASQITTKPAFVPTALMPSTNMTDLQGGAVVEALMSGDSVQFYSGLLTASNVVSADHNFTGGVIHVIDNFLTLPQNISTTLVALNQTAAAGALQAANIAAGPLPANLTAFIPNNDAFANIGNLLSGLSMQDLVGILSYHLVPDVVAYSTGLTNTSVKSLAGTDLKITVEGSNVFVNNAQVIVPNILVQEGVVHVINEVLNPANATLAPQASGTPVAFAGASRVSDLAITSGIPAPSSVPPAATVTGGAGAVSASAGSGSGGSSSGAGAGTMSTTTAGAARALETGAIGAAALFGGAAVFLNM